MLAQGPHLRGVASQGDGAYRGRGPADGERSPLKRATSLFEVAGMELRHRPAHAAGVRPRDRVPEAPERTSECCPARRYPLPGAAP
jgi:hypothetical protein